MIDKRLRTRRQATFVLASGLLLFVAVLGVNLAKAERSQEGNLTVSINGGLSPLHLPRNHRAPVALRIGGRISTTDGAPLPRLTHIRLALGGRGVLYTHGLPTCSRAQIRNATTRQALNRCGAAIVGRGSIDAEVFVPKQAPFPTRGRLLAFNGRTADGGRAVWVHAYAASPPVSVVLPFLIRRNANTLQTSLSAAVPASLGGIVHLSAFSLLLSRRFTYDDQHHSYLSATCPAPQGFTAGFLTFARATYDFAGGRRLRVEAVRSCHAR